MNLKVWKKLYKIAEKDDCIYGGVAFPSHYGDKYFSSDEVYEAVGAAIDDIASSIMKKISMNAGGAPIDAQYSRKNSITDPGFQAYSVNMWDLRKSPDGMVFLRYYADNKHNVYSGLYMDPVIGARISSEYIPNPIRIRRIARGIKSGETTFINIEGTTLRVRPCYAGSPLWTTSATDLNTVLSKQNKIYIMLVPREEMQLFNSYKEHTYDLLEVTLPNMKGLNRYIERPGMSFKCENVYISEDYTEQHDEIMELLARTVFVFNPLIISFVGAMARNESWLNSLGRMYYLYDDDPYDVWNMMCKVHFILPERLNGWSRYDELVDKFIGYVEQDQKTEIRCDDTLMR